MKQIARTITSTVLACFAISTQTCRSQTLSSIIDSGLAPQIIATARAAEAENNYTAALREYRRLLELYPNEPGLQAPIYLAMSANAMKASDPAQASIFADISKNLDPP